MCILQRKKHLYYLQLCGCIGQGTVRTVVCMVMLKTKVCLEKCVLDVTAQN